MPGKGKKLTEAQVEQHLTAYSQGTAMGFLDDAFGKWDQIRDEVFGGTQLPYLDRADHIIINGRTASEHLVERFNKIFPTLKDTDGTRFRDFQRYDQYQRFYKANAKKLIEEMTTNALASGGLVEVFVPDKATGRIKDRPLRLTKQGYEPAGIQAKPAQLSRWKRFWGKLGFYKQEREQYRQQMQSYESQQKARFCNKVGQASMHTNIALGSQYVDEMFHFHPELREDMDKNYPDAQGKPAALGQANGFKTARSCFYVTALNLLATQRDEKGNFLYTNDDLFDMDSEKMREARADAMKVVYERYKAGDRDWLIDQQIEASKVLPERINSQAKKLDFSRPDLVEQEGYRVFSLLNETAFDLSQDMSINKDQINDKYGTKDKDGKVIVDAYAEAAGRVGACSQCCRQWARSLLSQRSLLNGVPGKSMDGICSRFEHVFTAQVTLKTVAKEMAQGKNFTDIFDDKLLTKTALASGEARYDEDEVKEAQRRGQKIPTGMQQSMNLANEVIEDPGKFNGEIMSGVLEARFKLQDGSKETTFEITSSAAAKREIERQQARTRTGGGIGLGA